MRRCIPDLTGQVFGRLTVLERADRQRGSQRWRCRCECGEERLVVHPNLVRGGSTSCGCKRKDVLRARATHGHTRGGKMTPEYRCWVGIFKRTDDPGSLQFNRYGGRGIRICDGWRNSFAAFFADVGPKTSPKHTLDRIDNDGSYTCGHCDDCAARGATLNCRWATWKVQQRNRGFCKFIEFDGRRMVMADWDDVCGFKKNTIRNRIRDGWTPEEAITTPVRALLKRAA